ncbi:MAG: prepilin-type N-terminal cleavage/methylation domain-containing protein [Planctomycetota bacterium]
MRHAFTLIEIMVVIAIIAALAVMAAPSLMGSHRKAELTDQTQRLHDATRYVQRMAVVKQRTLRLVLTPRDPEHGGRSSYHVELMSTDLDAPQAYVKANGGSVKPTVLPEGLRLVDVKLDHGEPLDGTLAVRFFADGSADGAVIQLGDDRRVRSVVIESATGRVESVPRRVEALPSLREDLDA